MGIPVSGTNAAPLTPPAGDLANAYMGGSFTATGTSKWFGCQGPFNALLWGNGGPNGNWSGTVRLEWTFDGGTTWLVCGIGGSGQQAVYTSAGTGSDVSLAIDQVEAGVAFRWNCTVYNSGTINYRLSTTSGAPTSWGQPNI